MSDDVRSQLEEAFSAENRWYCSEHHQREVTDSDLLLEHYIKHGGAERAVAIVDEQAAACPV